MVHCNPTMPDPSEETRRRQEHAEAAAFEADALRQNNAVADYMRAVHAYHRAAHFAATEPEWK